MPFAIHRVTGAREGPPGTVDNREKELLVHRLTVLTVLVGSLLSTSAIANAACNTTFHPPASPYNGDPIDIVAAGANCNGSAASNVCNDTTIFQSAISFLQNTANGNGQGGEIDLPATKSCAVNLNISGVGISIVGRGKYSSILVPYSSGAPVVTVTSASTSNYGIELRNFGIQTRSGVGAPSAIYVTGTGINDNHVFEHLFIYSDPPSSPTFVNGINVDGRMIYAQFNDVTVDGASGSACNFDTSGSASPGAPIYHDTFRDLECNNSTGGWGLVVKSPNFTNGVYAFHTLDFEHINVQENYQGGAYINGVEEGGIYNSYIENNGVGSPSGGPPGQTTYGVAIQGTYNMAFNVVGNLIWGSGVALYNDSTYSTGVYYGNRELGSTVGSTYYADLAIQIGTSGHQDGILVGGNYDGGNYGLSGNVVQVPYAAGTVTLH